MELDDELCVCFHVSQRKVKNFIKVEKPSKVSQLSECFGAGTGCGWCRPYLRKLFASDTELIEVSSDDYLAERRLYKEAKKKRKKSLKEQK
ncbi:MAG: (2Fe-2S)-binding protein [Pirellulaceae bacterium]|nr:(2Fe-2S)-binding protein [Pirellulaceae bacterium]